MLKRKMNLWRRIGKVWVQGAFCRNPSERLSFEQRWKGGNRVSHVEISSKNILGRGTLRTE
jgi:hypothetical protein